MKKVDIVSKIVGRADGSARVPSVSAPSASVDLSGYLKKEVWDSVFEIRETEDGARYLLGKLPVALQNGLTMYVDEDAVKLPGIYDGLPIDGETIYWEETENGKVLKAKGGGTGGGSIEYALSWSGFSSGSYDGSEAKTIYIPSKVSELTNDSSYITSSALSGYATESYVTSRGYITSSSLSGYATETWVNNKGYVTSSALGAYLPLTGGTLTGPLYIDGARAFMPMDSNGYGLYFAGLNINIQKNHEYYAPFIGSDVNGNLQFATHPTISGSPIATQGWVSGTYLPKSGGTMTGNLWIPSAYAKISAASSGNAYITFYNSTNTSALGDIGVLSTAKPAFYDYGSKVWLNLVYNTNWCTLNTDSSSNPYLLLRHSSGTTHYVQNYNNYLYLGAGSSKSLRIDTNGNCLAVGGITMYSDERKKTIINHVQLSLKEVADAPLIEHYYNSDERKTTHVGSIAQYWAGLNDWFCKADDDGYYTMEIQNAALASAISVARELLKYETKTDKQIRRLKKRIHELEEEIEKLKG